MASKRGGGVGVLQTHYGHNGDRVFSLHPDTIQGQYRSQQLLTVVSMDSGERSSAFWMAEAARAKECAETMKNPLAKKGMENIAGSYEAFARRAERLTRPGLAADDGRPQPMDAVVSGSHPRPGG